MPTRNFILGACFCLLCSLPAFGETPLVEPLVTAADTNATAAHNATALAAPQEAAPTHNATELVAKQQPQADNASFFQPPVTKAVPKLGLLDEFSALRTELQRWKLLVAIEDQKKLFRKMFQSTAQRISGKSKGQDVSKPAKKRRARPRRPLVLSIQGVDGQLSATLQERRGSGRWNVCVGDDVEGGGKVVDIQPDEVVIRYDKKNVILEFAE